MSSLISVLFISLSLFGQMGLIPKKFVPFDFENLPGHVHTNTDNTVLYPARHLWHGWQLAHLPRLLQTAIDDHVRLSGHRLTL